MTKGGRQGFLPQAWWASKPQIGCTRIYRAILPKPTVFTEAQLMVLPCSAPAKVRQASPVPCHRAGDSCPLWEDTWQWQGPHAWDAVTASALAHVVWIKTGSNKMLRNQGQPKATAHRSSLVWILRAVVKQIPRRHSPVTLRPTAPRCSSHVDHLEPPQH